MNQHNSVSGVGAGSPSGYIIRQDELEQFICQYAALLFDLDGTLVDTMPLITVPTLRYLHSVDFSLAKPPSWRGLANPQRGPYPGFSK